MTDIIRPNKRVYIEISENEYIFDYKRLKGEKEEDREEKVEEENGNDETDAHFNLSSFIERIIKNHDNENATKGNGYNMDDPFLDDSELQENLSQIKERENMDDNFYVDRVNKPNSDKSKIKDSSESEKDDYNKGEKKMEEEEEEEEEEEDDEINKLTADIEIELNSLEQYVNYFQTDLKSQRIDEKINSIDLLIQKVYSQKRPKIYIQRLCSIFKVSKKEMKRKLNEIERKNKMKEMEMMKENEIKELVKKIVKEYENQKIAASSEVPTTFKIVKSIRTEIILSRYEKLMKDNNTISEDDDFAMSNIGKKIKNEVIREIVEEIPRELKVDERRIKDSLKIHKRSEDKSNRIIYRFPSVVMRKLDFTVNI